MCIRDRVYPRPDIQRDCLMPAIYGEHGIKSGHLQGESIELLERACCDVLEQGAEVIAPGFTEISIVAENLCQRGLPVIDINQVYARHAVDFDGEASSRPFKIGVVGGVGPAATVDLMNKIVRNTPARRDQEHIKIVVEQNPQIPDRTENLIGEGADPTVALYATCKKLEADEADLIVIPCNTVSYTHLDVYKRQAQTQTLWCDGRSLSVVDGEEFLRQGALIMRGTSGLMLTMPGMAADGAKEPRDSCGNSNHNSDIGDNG